MILYTHILLHLFLISISLDKLSHINSKSIIKRDNFAKLKKDTEEEIFGKGWGRSLGDLAWTDSNVSFFG